MLTHCGIKINLLSEHVFINLNSKANDFFYIDSTLLERDLYFCSNFLRITIFHDGLAQNRKCIYAQTVVFNLGKTHDFGQYTFCISDPANFHQRKDFFLF